MEWLKIQKLQYLENRTYITFLQNKKNSQVEVTFKVPFHPQMPNTNNKVTNNKEEVPVQ